jgi:hypothetical protein
VEALLLECVKAADEEVNRRMLKDVLLTDELCRLPYKEGQSAREALEAARSRHPSTPQALNRNEMTWAMKLGNEKHPVASQCIEQKLRTVWPFFYVERTFRKSAKGLWELMDAKEVKRLKDAGLTQELKGTLTPDLVLFEILESAFSLNSLLLVAIYDLKFRCLKEGSPTWNDYPAGHPFNENGRTRNQGDMYQEILRQNGAQRPPEIIWQQWKPSS